MSCCLPEEETSEAVTLRADIMLSDSTDQQQLMGTIRKASLFAPIMQPHQFKATPGEVELAECIQRTAVRKSTKSFSRDAAMRILRESGFSHGQIREIWTIADREGKGDLSNKELCALIRLAGWVQQCEEEVSESLLDTGKLVRRFQPLKY